MRSSKEIRQYFDLLPCDVQITKQRIMKDLKIGERFARHSVNRLRRQDTDYVVVSYSSELGFIKTQNPDKICHYIQETIGRIDELQTNVNHMRRPGLYQSIQ